VIKFSQLIQFELNSCSFAHPPSPDNNPTPPAYTLYRPVVLFRLLHQPSTTVVRRSQPILPCERARWLMLSGRCRRGGWRRPTGFNRQVGNPFRQPCHPFHPVTRRATPPSVKISVSACRNGRFYAFRGVARRHVTTTTIQTSRSTK
jgi:hypothetical protein